MLISISIVVVTMLIALNGILYQPLIDPVKSIKWSNINPYGKVLIAFIVVLTILNIYKSYYDEQTKKEEQKQLINQIETTVQTAVQGSPVKTIINEKILASVQGKRQKAIELALKLKADNIPYLWGGKRPKHGLDASSYVSYILGEVGVIKNPNAFWSGRLKNSLGLRTYEGESDLRVGDIIFYELGVTMLYLGEDTCIGMLTGGIHIKRINWGLGILGYGTY